MDSSSAPGTPKASHALEPADQMKYVLEHFKYLADQRMKTFNYYAIVVAASITGSLTAFDKCPWQLVAFIGVVHLAMASIFFTIDIRNSRLVHCARQALIHLENRSGMDRQLQVISCDQMSGPSESSKSADTRWDRQHPLRSKVNSWFGNTGASFTMAFNAAFFLQILCGICLIAAAWWLKGPGAAVAAH